MDVETSKQIDIIRKDLLWQLGRADSPSRVKKMNARIVAFDRLTAELAEARAELAALIAGDIHSCHDQCQREACVLRRELDALKARVEASPAVEITACNQVQGARDFDAGDMYAAAQQFEVGTRVRLLAEPQESV